MIRIRQIKVPVILDNQEYLLNKIRKILLNNKFGEVKIKKKSIDARNKGIFYIYEVVVAIENEEEIVKKINSKDIFIEEEKDYEMPLMGNIKLNNNIIIVGSGPAGLFCAYFLALRG